LSFLPLIFRAAWFAVALEDASAVDSGRASKTRPHRQAAPHLRHSGHLDRLRSRLRDHAVGLAALGTVSDALLLADEDLLIECADGVADGVWVDGAVAEEDEGAPDGLAEDVEHAVEDHLAVGGDDVAALRKTPADRVQEPEEDDPAGADHVGAVDGGADGLCVRAAAPEEVVAEEEEGGDADDEVAPFVGVGDDGAAEPGDDHDFSQEPCV